MRVRTFLFITALMLCHLKLWPQTLTKQFPAASGPSSLPDAPDYPIAEVVAAPPSGVPVRFESKQQEKHGEVYSLIGDVRIEYKDYILTADKVSYNRETGDAEADGHVRLQGGRNNELVLADHGKLNFELETGRFENVTGSIGRQPSASKKKLVYTTANPFLFTGRVLIKEGPERYQVVQGTMTSCLLPDPDWRIHSSLIRMNYGVAKAKNSYFTLLGVPDSLPALRHPPGRRGRQAERPPAPRRWYFFDQGDHRRRIDLPGHQPQHGCHFGHPILLQARLVAQRRFSLSRPWRRFCQCPFTALWDRGLAPDYLDQGGQDIVFSGRRDFDLDEHTRAVATGEYLSSFVYREAFAESFALAVASQVTSSAFITHNDAGRSASLSFDRYQNFEGITQVGQHLQHTADPHPARTQLDFDTIDRAASRDADALERG